MRAGKVAGLVARGAPGGGIGDEGLQGGAKAAAIVGRDEPAGAAVEKGLADAEGVVGDGGQTVRLGFDEEVGKRFTAGGMHREIGSVVERGGIGLPAEETHAIGEAEGGRAFPAGGEGGTVAGEPKLNRGGGVERGEDVDQRNLILLRTKHRHIEQHNRVGGGALRGAQGGAEGGVGRARLEQEGVVNDGDAFRREGVVGDDALAGGVAVGDDVAGLPQGTTEEQGQGLAGAQGGDDGGGRQRALQGAAVAVGHAAHAEHDVRRGVPGVAQETGRPPVEPGVAALQRVELETGARLGRVERAARAEGDELRVVPGGGEAAREQDRLAFGAAAAQEVLHDEYFHCPNRGGETKVKVPMNHPLFQLLLRWSIMALGVTVATKLVPGIECNELSTLIIVVVLLSFLNTVIKPVLMLFALPFIVLTMGVGIVLINATLFWLVGELVDGFRVESFWSALFGAFIVSVTNILVGGFLGTGKGKTAGDGSTGRGGRGGGGGGGKGKGKDDDVIDV